MLEGSSKIANYPFHKISRAQIQFAESRHSQKIMSGYSPRPPKPKRKETESVGQSAPAEEDHSSDELPRHLADFADVFGYQKIEKNKYYNCHICQEELDPQSHDNETVYARCRELDQERELHSVHIKCLLDYAQRNVEPLNCKIGTCRDLAKAAKELQDNAKSARSKQGAPQKEHGYKNLINRCFFDGKGTATEAIEAITRRIVATRDANKVQLQHGPVHLGLGKRTALAAEAGEQQPDHNQGGAPPAPQEDLGSQYPSKRYFDEEFASVFSGQLPSAIGSEAGGRLSELGLLSQAGSSGKASAVIKGKEAEIVSDSRAMSILSKQVRAAVDLPFVGAAVPVDGLVAVVPEAAEIPPPGAEIAPEEG